MIRKLAWLTILIAALWSIIILFEAKDGTEGVITIARTDAQIALFLNFLAIVALIDLYRSRPKEDVIE